jgi:hypothetical protein
VFGPSIRIFVVFGGFAINNACCFRFCYKEVFEFLCSQVVVVAVCLCDLVERFSKGGCGGVRLPSYCALIVFSNTFTLYPLMVLIYIDVVFCGVFRCNRVMVKFGLVG